jgi:four helix bundle protein
MFDVQGSLFEQKQVPGSHKEKLQNKKQVLYSKILVKMRAKTHEVRGRHAMILKKFEDIESWKEARNLVREIYTLFAECRDYGFRDQIQRASISVMSNIAEGFDRGSNKEFIQFLVIARGSLSEVKSLSYAGFDIGYLSNGKFEKIAARCDSLASLINGFIRYLKNSERKR